MAGIVSRKDLRLLKSERLVIEALAVAILVDCRKLANIEDRILLVG